MPGFSNELFPLIVQIFKEGQDVMGFYKNNKVWYEATVIKAGQTGE